MRYFKSIVAFAALLFATSCAVDDIDTPSVTPNYGGDAVTIIGRMTRFDDKDVTTRGIKNEDEAKLTSMALAIFPVKADGTGLDGNCVYYQYTANQQELLFTIERGSNYDYNKPYAMYVFVNMPGMEEIEGTFGEGTSLDAMLAKAYDVTNINIPENGFPMMGSLGDTFSTTFDKDNQRFILSPLDTNNHLVAPTVGGATKNLLTIPMKAMYAKVNFTIQVKADQQIEGNYSPQFTMSGYKVNNVPSSVDYTNATNSDIAVLDDSYNLGYSGDGVASGAKTINFSFYLPERLLTADKSLDSVLPANLKQKKPGDYSLADDSDQNGYRDEDEVYHQRFKSKMLGDDQKATNIVISGQFRDHQNHYWDVDYTIYLGENNCSDFNIKRNCEYNNYVTIRGIQSSDDMSDNGNAISIDHRVNVERTQPAIISLRREVLLDSHFEVRPLRIRKSDVPNVGNINAVKVEVVNPTTTDWMRIERSFGDGDIATADARKNSKGESFYITDESSPSYGKRRYFTTDLINGTTATNYPLKNSTEVVVPLNEADECVWIYVDECTEAGDGVRAGIIRVTYGNLNDSTFTPTENTAFPVVNYTINQRKLFEVFYDADSDNIFDSGERKYYIEYEEEYLHNFDADDDYGSTEFQGMEWGLDGVQLSHTNDALFFESSIDFITSIINYIKSNAGVNPKYDFYVKTHDTEALTGVSDKATKYGYSGYNFVTNIISYVNSGAKDTNNNNTADEKDFITTLSLNQQPKSAIEYCYNRNKRDNNGNVVDMVWYLPAVDEIEEIVTSQYKDPDGAVKPTYARFLEFQQQYYWASQPAYMRNYGYYNIWVSWEGAYFYDDLSRARSTSVIYDEGKYSASLSGCNGWYHGIEIYNQPWSPKYQSYTSGTLNGKQLNTLSYQPGNQPRTEKNRIRCVRKVATQQ